MTDKDWKAERRKGIGGSDAAAILGLSPWKSAMDVWLDKMDLATEVTDPAQTFLLDLGKELEPVVARLYEKQTGRGLFQPFGPYVHPKFPMLRGNPDRIVKGGDEPRGVELKTETVYSDKFGEPGTDEVPFHYLIQCAHYMMVTDFPVWDIALLKNGTTFGVYTIHRDADLERDIQEQLLAWWEKHIVGKVPPDVDGSGAWKAYLRLKFPADILPVMGADKNILNMIASLKVVREILDKYGDVKDALENRLKLVIGEHEGLEGEFGKITWKKSKDSQYVDWKHAFIDLQETGRQAFLNEWRVQNSEAFDALCENCKAANTEPKPGSRRFLFNVKEGWAYGNREIEGADVPRLAREIQSGDREGATEAPERRTDGTDRADVLP